MAILLREVEVALKNGREGGIRPEMSRILQRISSSGFPERDCEIKDSTQFFGGGERLPQGRGIDSRLFWLPHLCSSPQPPKAALWQESRQLMKEMEDDRGSNSRAESMRLVSINYRGKANSTGTTYLEETREEMQGRKDVQKMNSIYKIFFQFLHSSDLESVPIELGVATVMGQLPFASQKEQKRSHLSQSHFQQSGVFRYHTQQSSKLNTYQPWCKENTLPVVLSFQSQSLMKV